MRVAPSHFPAPNDSVWTTWRGLEGGRTGRCRLGGPVAYGTKREDLARYAYQPDLVVSSLAEFSDLLADTGWASPWSAPSGQSHRETRRDAAPARPRSPERAALLTGRDFFQFERVLVPFAAFGLAEQGVDPAPEFEPLVHVAAGEDPDLRRSRAGRIARRVRQEPVFARESGQLRRLPEGPGPIHCR